MTTPRPPFVSYLTPVKTAVVDALTATFDASYPNPDFRSVHVSIEYPVDPQDYPGVWVNYDDTADAVRAGVNHLEYVDPVTGDPAGPFTRWRYTGAVSFTVVALTSLERDLLYDELVGTIAFGSQDVLRGRFRTAVQANEFVTVDLNYDTITPGGEAATPGTQWGSDEIVYERTFSLEVIGEFYPAAMNGRLALLSRIQVDTPQVVESGGMPLIGQSQGSTTSDWH